MITKAASKFENKINIGQLQQAYDNYKEIKKHKTAEPSKSISKAFDPKKFKSYEFTQDKAIVKAPVSTNKAINKSKPGKLSEILKKIKGRTGAIIAGTGLAAGLGYGGYKAWKSKQER